ncbi:MAG: hypothetical protein AAGF84_06005 [Planctomycetota bacterium]
MSRRRQRGRAGAAPFSLFAFQDIMAAVTGVMIVTTLLMVIDLLTRTVAAAPSRPVVVEQANFEDPAEDVLALLEAEASAELITPDQRDAMRQALERVEQRVTTIEDANQALQERSQRQAQQESRLREQMQATAEQLTDTREQIDAIRQRPPVTLLKGDASGKPTWWVRLDGRRVQASELLSDTRENPDGALPPIQDWADVTAFLTYAETLDPQSRAWVLLVEPTGIDAFAEAQEALRRRGFDVGWDLAPMDTPHAERGAAR